MLSRRQIQIIELLEHKGSVKGAEIAEKIRISKRTAIREIHLINHLLEDMAVINNDGQGYYISITDREGFYQKLESSGLDDEMILLELLQNAYLTLDQLSERLYLSKPVLTEKIAGLRKKYKNRLVIRSRSNHGHFLEEPLNKKLVLLANIIEQNPGYFCKRLSVTPGQYKKMVQVIRDHFHEIPFSHIHSTHLAGLFISAKLLGDQCLNEIKDEDEDSIISNLYIQSGMEAGAGVKILAGFFEKQSRLMKRMTHEDIRGLVQMLEQEYRIQICDPEMIALLTEHLKRSLAYPQILFYNRGFLLEEMKAVYPLAFDLGIQFVQLLYERFQIEIYNMELIGLYFSSVMTKHQKKEDKIILFSTQYAVANINKLLIEQKIPEIEVQIVHEKSELAAKLGKGHSSLLINNQAALAEAGLSEHVTVIDVKQIAGEDDLNRIENAVKNMKIKNNIHRYFPKEALPAVETEAADTWLDVVERGCRLLTENGILIQSEADRILSREQAGNNLVINHMAVPHCITPRNLSFFSVFLHLTNPVAVEGNLVQNMLITCTNSNIREGVKVFHYLYHKLSQPEGELMLRLETYEEFLRIVE